MDWEKRYWLVVGLLFFTGVCIWALNVPDSSRVGEIQFEFPDEIGGWRGVNLEYDAEVYEILGADAMIMKAFRGSHHGPIYLYVAYYRDMDKADLSHSPLLCYPGQGWRVVYQGREVLGIDGVPASEVNKLVVEKGEERQLVFYWFQSGDRVVAGRGRQRISAIWEQLRRRRTDSLFVRLSSPIIGGNIDETFQNMSKFANDVFPYLCGFFGQPS